MMQIASDTPQDKNLYKTDNALSEYNILQLSSELYFTVVKILKFPMWYMRFWVNKCKQQVKETSQGCI